MSAIGAQFLAHHLAFRPVDGTFMGERACDARLARADARAAADEARAISELEHAVARAPESSAAERLDKRIARAELTLAGACLAHRPRFSNPAWYTGEAIFSIVGLLLPQSRPLAADALAARLQALPDFLADGRARLREAGAAPAGWSERARREAKALSSFLEGDLAGVDAAGAFRPRCTRAAAALEEFTQALHALPDRDPAAGAQFLSLVMRDVHGLEVDAKTLHAQAASAFERLGRELQEDAARLAPGQSWQQAIAALSANTPPADGVLQAYRHWHERAVGAAQAGQLVTPADDYGLDYRFLENRFLSLAPESYFLFYRSPPALNAGAGSVYWVTPPGQEVAAYLRSQNISTLKTTHTVHHGSIGHHTQNARAREAPGVLARVGGTDCACGIAFLSAGTMVEGWACYAEELLLEAGGFYTDAERLLLKQDERRNAASVLVDVNLHLGRWTLDEAARFYRDEAGFAAQRVVAETVRNSMFPGSRLMYWSGVESIRALRRADSRSARDFHDALLRCGHVPIAAAGAELARASPG